MVFLSANNVSKRYKRTVALDGFSLSVNRQEIFALVGPDGAGKTTLIRILCGLLTPDSGKITMDGLDLFTSHQKLKSLMGYMPQQFSLYPDLSVEENLVFYAGLYGMTGERYKQKRDHLYEFSNLAPFADRRSSALSGGMKQKLALSCALIHEPKILILDEPTTGVDPLSRRQFWEMLLQLKTEGVTILVSTPYMDEVARCDRACFVFGGRKLSEGRPKDLTAEFRGEIYALECAPTVQLVEQLNSIDGIEAIRFGGALHLRLNEGDSIDSYSNALNSFGIDLTSITPIEPSLEDRFIQLMDQTE